MADRLSQVAGHITNSHGRGLLTDEVAIVTGTRPELIPYICIYQYDTDDLILCRHFWYGYLTTHYKQAQHRRVISFL